MQVIVVSTYHEVKHLTRQYFEFLGAGSLSYSPHSKGDFVVSCSNLLLAIDHTAKVEVPVNAYSLPHNVCAFQSSALRLISTSDILGC